MPSRVESTRKHEKVIKDETKQACAMQGNLCILEMCNGCVQSLQSVQLCNLCMENEGMQCHADNFFSFLFFFLLLTVDKCRSNRCKQDQEDIMPW